MNKLKILLFDFKFIILSEIGSNLIEKFQINFKQTLCACTVHRYSNINSLAGQLFFSVIFPYNLSG